MAQISVRLPDELSERIRKVAEETGRTQPQIVAICVRNFLPVIEKGIYGTPGWRKLKEIWDADIEKMASRLESLLPDREPHVEPGTRKRKTA